VCVRVCRCRKWRRADQPLGAAVHASRIIGVFLCSARTYAMNARVRRRVWKINVILGNIGHARACSPYVRRCMRGRFSIEKCSEFEIEIFA
jgi:hypothetical protein